MGKGFGVPYGLTFSGCLFLGYFRVVFSIRRGEGGFGWMCADHTSLSGQCSVVAGGVNVSGPVGYPGAVGGATVAR